MSLIDKLAKEADRKTQDDWQKVYLYKEGTFFHAFNESAWLLTTFIYSEDFRKSLGDNRGLQVSHTISKMAGDYLVAGFPIRSLDKYVTGCEIEEIDDVFVCKVNPIFCQHRKQKFTRRSMRPSSLLFPPKSLSQRKGHR